MSGRFTVAFVPGVTPDKWVRRWAQRRDEPLDTRLVEVASQLDVLRGGQASMAFVRDVQRPDDLHLVPLYDEVPVVVVNAEHPAAAYDEIALEELDDEPLMLDPAVPAWEELAPALTTVGRPLLPRMTLREGVETVAAGTGVLVTPMSVARVHQRKDVVAVPVLGVPTSSVGLAWRRTDDDERIEEFVGIVRGRTERSSRGRTQAADPPAVRSGERRAAAGAPSSRRARVTRRSGRPRRR